MKGLILAAGRGVRLQPLTDARPKPLLPIAGQPILQYNIANLRDAGVEEIAIVISSDAPQIPCCFGDGSTLGVRLTYVTQERLLGTAHAVSLARDAIGDEPFVLTFGDNMTGYRLARLVEAYRRCGGGSMLAVSEGGNPQKHAVVSVAGNRVASIEERPKVPRGPYTSAGMFVFDSSIFPAIRQIGPVSNGEYYLPHAIQALIDVGGPVHYTVADSWRVNINSPADMLTALRHVLADESCSPPSPATPASPADVGMGVGVRVQRNVVFGGPAYVGNYSWIGCNSRIASAILMDRVVIGPDCCITNAILGSGVVVHPGTRAAGNGAPLVVPDRHVLTPTAC